MASGLLSQRRLRQRGPRWQRQTAQLSEPDLLRDNQSSLGGMRQQPTRLDGDGVLGGRRWRGRWSRRSVVGWFGEEIRRGASVVEEGAPLR
jgi:hypothetical protein